MWKDEFMEDIEVLEGSQAERMAPSYAGGEFSAVMDYTTHYFHRWVAQRMMQTG